MIKENDSGYELKSHPKYVGFWKMPGAPVRFAATEKPRWYVRFMMKWLMGWEWKDEWL